METTASNSKPPITDDPNLKVVISEVPQQNPVMDIHKPQPVLPDDGGPVPSAATAPAASDNPPVAKAKPVAHKPSKLPASQNEELAIIATVVIVLGLAAMAVYAYLQTK